MRIIVFLILFALIGLIVGYFIYGKVNDEYVEPVYIFEKKENIMGWAEKKIFGLEKMREKILLGGVLGGIVGLFFGALTRKKKS